ncbi:hypothetical protein [Pseudomonas sp. M5]|uniref:hypothetical protein n=1 Tax=Pseudomonas sp. M5 TaxID=1620788 RepID=UPI00195EBACA|nr:hypothetical protein [Pseudomonas sp. M5]MBM7397253.1 hypothetical protein [Pseudomonas sp. M5]HDS1756980.1 hypothetical protein [Pseudomonas putida]
MTTARIPARFAATIETTRLLYTVHALLPLKSQRQIAAELGISRRRVAALAQLPAPLDMSATADPSDFWISQEVAPTMKRTDAVDAILALATRPEGVRYHEYTDVLAALFGIATDGSLNMQEPEHRRLRDDVKRKAKVQRRVALFVPAWIAAHDPRGSHRAMLDAAQSVFEAIEYAALEFAQRFPGVPYQSVMHELRCLAIPGFSNEPLGQRLDRTADVVNHLAGHPINIVQQMARPESMRVPAVSVPEVARDDSELARLCI